MPTYSSSTGTGCAGCLASLIALAFVAFVVVGAGALALKVVLGW
jgi:hypothetical protein